MLKLALMLLPLAALALPEARLDTHSPEQVMAVLGDPALSDEEVRARLSRTGVPELDRLWDERQDVQALGRECEGACGVVSRFEGHQRQHPLVILTGFTGYRKMYLEAIYDLITAGYGPIYALDFRGQGEAIGDSPAIRRFVARQGRKARRAFQAGLNQVPAAGPARDRLLALPVGVGHIESHNDYIPDVNFIMGLAAFENPGKKIVVHAHSSGGLALMLALGQRAADAPWIAQTSRVFLETALLRNKQTDQVIPGFAPLTEVLGIVAPLITGARKAVYADRALPEFLRKALGAYDPANNTISHSPNRIRMSDGIRVWSGYETVGATWGWARATINAHYDSINPDWKVKEFNKSLGNMQKNLASNNVGIVAVTTDVDAFAVSDATTEILRRLAGAGVEAHECRYSDSRHGLHQEIDLYRDPFMALWADQIEGLVRPSYGNGVLPCQQILVIPKAE